MIKINAKENNVLSFETTIDGNIKQVDSVSIIIPSSRGFDIKIPATFNENVVECNIPALYDLLESGNHSFTLEMVIDGKKFEPLTEELVVESPVEITAKAKSVSTKNTDTIIESEPSITVTPTIKTSKLSSFVKRKSE